MQIFHRLLPVLAAFFGNCQMKCNSVTIPAWKVPIGKSVPVKTLHDLSTPGSYEQATALQQRQTNFVKCGMIWGLINMVNISILNKLAKMRGFICQLRTIKTIAKVVKMVGDFSKLHRRVERWKGFWWSGCFALEIFIVWWARVIHYRRRRYHECLKVGLNIARFITKLPGWWALRAGRNFRYCVEFFRCSLQWCPWFPCSLQQLRLPHANIAKTQSRMDDVDFNASSWRGYRQYVELLVVIKTRYSNCMMIVMYLTIIIRRR